MKPKEKTKKRVTDNDIQIIGELLKKLLILELGKIGVPQHRIRKIVGGDIHKVNEIVKHIKKRDK